MTTHEEVRRLACALPAVEDQSADGRLKFSVAGGKGLAWTYSERVAPRRPRIVRPEVLAVRCALETKEVLLAAAPERFFDDDHYRGYGAVLVRLDAIDTGELGDLLAAAWRLSAPRRRLAGGAGAA